MSIKEVRSLPNFWTIHGLLFGSAEQLLREFPARNSLRALVAAMGGGKLALPSGPVLCQGFVNNLLWELAFDGKEPTYFEFNQLQRRLDVKWEGASSQVRWLRMSQLEQADSLPKRRFSLFGRRNYFYLERSWVGVGNMEVIGLEDEVIVAVNDRRFVLPNTPLASLLSRIYSSSRGNVSNLQRKHLFELIVQFGEALTDPEGDRSLKRFYEYDATELSDIIPLKEVIEVLKVTKGRIFTTSAWVRKKEEQ